VSRVDRPALGLGKQAGRAAAGARLIPGLVTGRGSARCLGLGSLRERLARAGGCGVLAAGRYSAWEWRRGLARAARGRRIAVRPENYEVRQWAAAS
jgi:hypothetical protein